MSEWRQEQEQTVVVASFTSRAEAEFLRVTLAANGIQAVVSVPSSVYPSLDFVEGIDVRVRAADEEAARDILRKLSQTKT